jgi:tetratricopeptide (TPR) repeat protein
VLAAAGRPGEAERAMRRAAELRPDEIDPWVALVAHLARRAREEPVRAPELLRSADDAVEEMKTKVPAERQPLALALCDEAMDHLAAAAHHFADAVAGDPRNGVVLQRAAQFHLRLGRPAEAEPLLRRLLEPKTLVPEEYLDWPRRQLALALSDLRDAPGRPEGESGDAAEALALRLLEANRDGGRDPAADERARAFVRGARAEGRKEAIRVVVASAQRRALAPEERYRLAKLYVAESDFDKAREEMQQALAAAPTNPEYLAFHVRCLLDRKRLDEARPFVERLRKIEPDSARTRALLAELEKGAQEEEHGRYG